jgi:hypothetical protein
LQLAPGLTAGMTVRADVAAAEPAMVRTIRLGTEVGVRVDRPSATSGEGDHRWGRSRCLGASISRLLTGLAERFVEEPSEGLRLFGAFTLGLIGLKGPVRCGPGMVGPPEMDHEETKRPPAESWRVQKLSADLTAD